MSQGGGWSLPLLCLSGWGAGAFVPHAAGDPAAVVSIGLELQGVQDEGPRTPSLARRGDPALGSKR